VSYSISANIKHICL